jgi:MYXO-CTERM domain-containing protein
MKRIPIGIGLLFSGLCSTAGAAVPAGYKGTPFDPNVAGGTFNGMPTSSITTAGPYPIPGRLEFENYDMGGLNVGYFTTDHIGCAAGAYRKDGQTPSLCATSPMSDTTYDAPNGDVFYGTGTALDGTTYPNATTEDVYIGAVRPGDWVKITVNVQTAGTYVVGSTWASGNGNPGKEGGNGAMELQVFVNDTMMLDWKDTFPNYNTTANFHNWKTYPDMGVVTLQAGLQVIKLQSPDPHLNLDYVELSLVGADGGILSGGSGSQAGSGASSGSSTSGSPTSGSSTSGTLSSAGTGSGDSTGASAGTGSASGDIGAASGSASSGSTAAVSGAASGATGGGSGTLTASGSGVGAGTGTNGSTAGTPGASLGAHVNAASSSSKGCAVAPASDGRSSHSAWPMLVLAAAFLAVSRRSRHRTM